MDTSTLEQIAKKLQKVIEETSSNFPTGTCYLFGHCLNEIFNKQGLTSRKVTGHLALLCQNKRHVVYGKLKVKGPNVGDYHTWCEVTPDDTTYVVDPSLKYNRVALVEHPDKIKLDRSIPNILISNKLKTHKFAYVEDDSLETHSLKFLNTIPEDAITEIIDEVISSI